MSHSPTRMGWLDRAQGLFLRVAASGWISPKFFLHPLPEPGPPPPEGARLRLEIVSHCWQYSHLLAYQLSSLVRYPPTKLSVRMTVFYAPEDAPTADLLRFFSQHEVPNVEWCWRPLEPGRLFRRAIGRNLAARETTADWIWFTDCDVAWHEGCLDALATALVGRRERLLFPRQEHCTPLLTSDDPVLQAGGPVPALVALDVHRCRPVTHTRAVGPLQITPGDVARQVGYCACLRYYQQPADHWQKAYEDRAYRWLLRTEGTPIDVPGVYRIKHLDKGRYRNGRWTADVRRTIRRVQGRRRAARAGAEVASPPSPMPMHLLAWFRKRASARRDRKHRPELEEFLAATAALTPDDVAIDCGANVGKFTLMMARRGATVHAFEPNPAAYAALCANVADHPNVRTYPAAVTTIAGRVSLFLHKWADEDPVHWSTGSSLLAAKNNVRRDRTATVEAVNFAEFVRGLGASPIALLKMDIEGAEVDVLNQLLDQGLHQRITRAFVETHDRRVRELVEPTRRLRERLRDLGATQFRLDWR